MGAKTILEKAAPNAEIVEVSGYPNWVARQRELGQLAGVSNVFGPGKGFVKRAQEERKSITDRSVNIGELVDADIAVLPGCVLYPFALKTYRPLIQDLYHRDIPLILLGAGGGDYERSTQQYVRNFFNNIQPAGLITRDEVAYEQYSDSVEHTHNGIDCAFFIKDWYDPVQANTSFDALTFDKINEPKISGERKYIRPHHLPFDEPHRGFAQKVQTYKNQRDFFKLKNILISDNILDYLFIYRNAVKTHSDRIHACVPALSYGNEAQFWLDTPRAALFDRVYDKTIYEKPVSLDMSQLSEQKSEQVSAVARIISNVGQQHVRPQLG